MNKKKYYIERQIIRKQRKALSSDFFNSAAKNVFDRVIQLPQFRKAKHIACYLSHENEIDTALIIAAAYAAHKQVYLPIFSDQKENPLSFYLVKADDSLKKNKLGILEPVAKSAPVSVETFDLMFVPMVAFDEHCNRLGRGVGAYDRYLEKHRPYLIGLAYEFQKLDAITRESWDVPMDCVVTENKIYS